MTTSISDVLAQSVKDAMRARDSVRLATLRFLQAAIRQKEVDERRTLDDGEVLAIVERQVKQRRESIAAFEKAGRKELAEKESHELGILQEFLPQAASAEEVQAAIDAAVRQAGEENLSGGAAMGRVMGLLKAALAGRADMAEVSAMVRQKLA